MKSQAKIGIIYMYTSPSKKMYIGQTINEKSRKSQHKNETIKTKTYFGKALNKYGFDNFEYKVLIKFKPTLNIEKLKRVLNKLEERYIKLYKSNNVEFGYNLNKGGDGNLGYKHTDEMISYLKSVPKSEKQLDNLNLGRSHTEESKEKLRQANINKMKKVGKYDLENNLLKTFNSIADAARSLEGSTQKTKHNKISDCCNNRSKTNYGYIWKFII